MIKLLSYIFLMGFLFLVVSFNVVAFKVLSYMVMFFGLAEMYYVYFKSGRLYGEFFAFAMAVYLLLTMGFTLYAKLNIGQIMFSLLLVAIFEGIYGLSRCLFFRTGILEKFRQPAFPSFVAGCFATFFSAILLRQLIDQSILTVLFLSVVIVIFVSWGHFILRYFRKYYGVHSFNLVASKRVGLLDLMAGYITGSVGFLLAIIFLGAITG